MPKIGVIIQARLTSNRFPRKITQPINGRPMLEHLVTRVHLLPEINEVIIAAPHSPECCLNEKIFIGSETDVLDRYYQAAKEYNLDVIIRLTSDCPLVPPGEILRVLARLLWGDTDYVYNFPGVPDGWDVEAFTFKALEKAWKESSSQDDREHVTQWMKRDGALNPIHLEPPKLSVDTEADLEQVRNYYGLELKAYLGDWRDGFVCDSLHQSVTLKA